APVHQLRHLGREAALSHQLEVGLRLQHRLDALADHLVVVHDQDPDGPAAGQRHAALSAGSGTQTLIASPLSSPLETVNRPAASSTMRRNPFSPKWVALSG